MKRRHCSGDRIGGGRRGHIGQVVRILEITDGTAVKLDYVIVQ